MQFFFKIKETETFTINIQTLKYWLNTKTSEWLYIISNNDLLCIFNSDNYNRTDMVSYIIKKNLFAQNQDIFKQLFTIHTIKDELDLGKYLIKYFINDNLLDNIDITVFKILNISGYSKHKLLSIINFTNSITNKSLTCSYCSKKFSTPISKTNHENKFCSTKNNYTTEMKINNLENENKILKEKLKNKKKKELIENPIINITNNNNIQISIDKQNNIINNNINLITKKDKLNHFYKDTIDIDTFIEKYKTVSKYQLTYEESDALLTVLENSYINYSIGLFNYLKNKYSMVFNDINPNKEQNNIKQNILPFILSDSSLRTHYEKNQDSWNIVKNNDNIKKLITESNNQVYNHHNKSPLLTSSEMKKVSNSLLRESTDISKLDFENQLQNNNTVNENDQIENKKEIENKNILDLELD
jgi:hypothetical protein